MSCRRWSAAGYGVFVIDVLVLLRLTLRQFALAPPLFHCLFQRLGLSSLSSQPRVKRRFARKFRELCGLATFGAEHRAVVEDDGEAMDSDVRQAFDASQTEQVDLPAEDIERMEGCARYVREQYSQAALYADLSRGDGGGGRRRRRSDDSDE